MIYIEPFIDSSFEVYRKEVEQISRQGWRWVGNAFPSSGPRHGLQTSASKNGLFKDKLRSCQKGDGGHMLTAANCRPFA